MQEILKFSAAPGKSATLERDKTLFSLARAPKGYNKLKEILFVIFGFLFLAGLVVFLLRFIKDRNPNDELLIELFRCMNANGSEAIQKKKSQYRI